MLKNEKVIYRMEIEERIQFITSNILYQTSKVKDYDFPTIELVDNPLENKNVKATEYCSLKFLASTWNDELIEGIYKRKTIESNCLTKFGYFGLYGEEYISCSPYFNGRFITNAVNGINDGNGEVCVINSEKSQSEIEKNENTRMPYQMVAESSTPDVILVTDYNQIKRYREKYNYKNLFFGKAKTHDGVLQMLAHGCSYVFIDEESTPVEEIGSYIASRVERYKECYNEFKNHRMSSEEFCKLLNDGDIIDEECINQACDNIIELLDGLEQENNVIKETPVSLSSSNASFDEKEHDVYLYEASKQGIILLKNLDNLLPIGSNLKVAVIGDYASNDEYHKESQKVTPTKYGMPLDLINAYDEINKVGFAHGYLKELKELTPELVNEAVNVTSLSDVTIVYLTCEDDATSLDNSQLELLETIAKQGKKIVGILMANKMINMDFADYLDALIFAYPGGQEVNKAIVDTLVGYSNPSGKVIESNTQGSVIYNIGHGLSYCEFEYSHFNCDSEGVKFTITNKSDISGYVTPQLYVVKENTESTLKEKQLRGFSKEFVHAHESIQVSIDFNDMTFRNWNAKQKCYEVEGGQYELLVGDSYDDIRLSGSIVLKHFLYDEDLFRNEEVVDEVSEDFVNTPSKKEYNTNRKGGLSFKAKIVLLSLILLYFDALGIILSMNTDSAGLKILLFVMGAIFTGFIVYRMVYVITHHKKMVDINPNDDLTKFIENVDNFEEEARLTFEIPIEKEEEEEKKEEVIEDITEEEQKVKNYLAKFRQGNNENGTYIKEGISIHEICQSFTSYAAGRKVIIEPASCRAIISAIASSKIVFIDTKTKDVLPDFLHIVNDFFGVDYQIQHASDEWNKFDDLAWKEENNEYVISDFINTVQEANNNPKKFHIAVLDNVNMDNFDKYFHNFVLFANNPSLDRAININEELQLKLPRNICYLIIPQDDKFMDKMPRQIADASISLDIVMRFAKSDDDTTEKEAISFSYPEFIDSVNEARKTFFLSEDLWKKIDEFEHTIASKEVFRIGNKNTLAIEKYTSVFIECGGDEAEAFDNIFSQKVVPIIKTTSQYKEESGEKVYVNMIEKIFGNDGITKILRAISKKA